MTPTGADSRRERLLAWTAVALWTGLIFLLSTDSFSADETAGILGPLLDRFFAGLDATTRARLHLLIRKAAHVSEYAVLAVLTWRALRTGPPGRERRSVVLTLAFVASIACLDEAGQATRASRTGSPWDVALDAAGGAAGLSVALAARRVRRRRRIVVRPGIAASP